MTDILKMGLTSASLISSGEEPFRLKNFLCFLWLEGEYQQLIPKYWQICDQSDWSCNHPDTEFVSWLHTSWHLEKKTIYQLQTFTLCTLVQSLDFLKTLFTLWESMRLHDESLLSLGPYGSRDFEIGRWRQHGFFILLGRVVPWTVFVRCLINFKII